MAEDRMREATFKFGSKGLQYIYIAGKIKET